MKTIGIIGGMGPLATADLFYKIITFTEAGSDNEHIPILIDNNTRIPDRTAAILRGGESPIKELVNSAIRLQRMGADFLIMPCNTAHWYYEDITRHVGLPLVNMIEETCRDICGRDVGRIGLLATDGTLSAGIYDEAFGRFGIDFIKPDPMEQAHVMEMIYSGIKGENREMDITPFCDVLRGMERRGAEAFVLGCTELPIAFDRFAIAKKAVNPTAILAARAVTLAGGSLSQKAVS